MYLSCFLSVPVEFYLHQETYRWWFWSFGALSLCRLLLTRSFRGRRKLNRAGLLGWVPCSVLSAHTASHVLLGREQEAPGKLWPLDLCCPHCTCGQDGLATLNWKIKEVQHGWSRADVFTRWWVSWGAINVTARAAAEGTCTWGQWNYGFLGSHHYFNKRKSILSF